MPLAAERGESKRTERRDPAPGIGFHFSGPQDDTMSFQVFASHHARQETAFW